MKNPKIIVIGAGAAGIAVTSRLLENGITDITVLEAENRIGGRIHSIDFGGSIVDLGAQWCHGEENNIVYKLVKNLDLLSPSYNAYDDFTFYESTGKIIKKNITDQLFQIASKISSDDKALKSTDKSFGEYFTERYNEEINKEFKNNEEYLGLATEWLEFFHKLVICLDSAPSWFDVSAKGSVQYEECEGHYYYNWRDKGYRMILYVLMKKYPDFAKQLPVDDKIFLNKDVSKIVWDNNSINHGGVTVECLDGSSYNADHVIVTVPLGVLKQKYKSIFSPELPLINQNAISALGFGTVNKILLKFPSKWWPDDCKGFSLVWTKKDSENIVNEFPHGPSKNGKSWLEDVYGFYVTDNHPRVLLGWVVGDQCTEIEQLPNDIIINGCMYLLKKFVGNKYSIPQPEDVLRSFWSTNRHFCGSYSYRSLFTEEQKVSAQDIATPLVANNKQVVLFSGEATHPHFFSTVHGAIESGFREADRIINIYRNCEIKDYRLVIVGAGLAGLGAARTLLKAGYKDFIVLEAQDDVGGRIRTIRLNDGIIDLGAQWIHGTGTSLYNLAKRYNLLSSVTSEEGLGIYVRDDGVVFDNYLVKQVDFEIGRILEQCETFTDAIEYPDSVGEFLEEKFTEYLQRCDDTNDIAQMKMELLDWHIRFQIIDNSCANLKNLSAKDWGKYFCPNNNSQAHINLKTGYKSLIDALMSLLPDSSIRCNTAVSKVQWQTANGNVRIECDDKLIVNCDHVIVTTSLGVLKHCTSNFFEPPLPDNFTKTINYMGYSGIGKIFLVFDYKWWNTEGFQLIWRKDAVLNGPSNWTRNISGFDIVLNQPNVLLAWVGGESVAEMENLSEKTVGFHCIELLKRFLKREDIPLPSQVVRSQWLSNPWIRGGYSHTTTECDRIGVGPSKLTEPIFHNGRPILLFAGEAGHPNYFSTTHGAFESGENQAKLLLEFI